MNFVKMHGAANDYVYVDCFVGATPGRSRRPGAADRRPASGRRGRRADPRRAVRARAAARMRMFNADGSESEMCGNGVRCVAHWSWPAATPRPGRSRSRRAAACSPSRFGRRARGRAQVRVDMGEPLLDGGGDSGDRCGAGTGGRRRLPALGCGGAWWEACGLDPRMTCVSMGNPHAIFYCRDVAAVPLETVGPRIEQHPSFPRRVNVHLCEVARPRHVRMRTWERGSGITLACGTGASAVCVAGVLTGRTAAANPGRPARGAAGTGVARRRAGVHDRPGRRSVYAGAWPGT